MSYQPPPPPYQPQPPGQMYGGVAPTNQKAIWSLVTGIVSLFCCGIVFGIVAIVLGHQAKQEIELSGGAQQGHGQAQAGFILGIIGAALWLLVIVFYLIVGVAGFTQCAHAGNC